LQTLKFQGGSQIADLTLKERVHSTALYETWEVYRQDPMNKTPMIAHIFKYSLTAQFSLKESDLDLFCNKIVVYNEKMAEKKIKL